MGILPCPYSFRPYSGTRTHKLPLHALRSGRHRSGRHGRVPRGLYAPRSGHRACYREHAVATNTCTKTEFRYSKKGRIAPRHTRSVLAPQEPPPRRRIVHSARQLVHQLAAPRRHLERVVCARAATASRARSTCEEGARAELSEDARGTRGRAARLRGAARADRTGPRASAILEMLARSSWSSTASSSTERE